jgi:serine/threonine protein kinase|tara:strand:+ start:1191 stop:1868 length:678 start_codon:yes stop_codon:yes gene_type:complete
MGTTASSSRSKTGKPGTGRSAAASGTANAADVRAAAATRKLEPSLKSFPTLKNIRRVQDVYDMKSVLGTGGYAVVWSATHKHTTEEFAIKVMKATASAKPQDDEVTVDEIRNEIDVMRKLQHPNVIYVKEYFVQSGKFYIVMSLLKGGELLDALLDLGNYTEEDAKKIAKQLLDALAYMHMNNVTHRDLKVRPFGLSQIQRPLFLPALFDCSQCTTGNISWRALW